MTNIIKKSFRLQDIFALRKYKNKSFFSLFILLLMLGSLPLNLLIIKNKGWKFNPIVIHLEDADFAWELKDQEGYYFPNLSFYRDGLKSSDQYELKTDVYHFYFNYFENEIDTEHGNVVLFAKEDVIFYRPNGKKLIGSYQRLEKPIHFDRIATEEEAKRVFIDLVETVFSGPFIFSSILIWTFANIFMQTVLLFLVSAIFLLIRINFKKVAYYREYLRIYISCLVVPTIISVFIGLWGELGATFAPVLLQFGTALMMIGVIYKGSKAEITPARLLKDQM